ncbi:putative L-asparaginase [Peptococcaceae bacterium CEB3]|nr:putative L-asparaginase [Peptococcaceae bacterium CEB3]
MRKDTSGKSVPALNGEHLLDTQPKLAASAQWEIRNFSNFASCNMTPAGMKSLALAVNELFSDPAISGIVITHGTDTLEETAYFLDTVLTDPRPIVLTAAQRDSSEADSDGPRNLLEAMLVALDPSARERGTLVVLNSEIHAARDVRKLHTSQVNAFTSGAAGSLGTIDLNRVYWHRPPSRTPKLTLPDRLANIALVKIFTDMPVSILEAFLASAEGLVLEAFGRGNIPPELVPALAEAVQRGLPVVITSRCLFGRTAPAYGYPGGGADLERTGAWFAGDLSSEKVRLFLALALGLRLPLPEIKRLLETAGREPYPAHNAV